MKAISVPEPGDLLWLLIGRGLRGQLCPLGALRLRSLSCALCLILQPA